MLCKSHTEVNGVTGIMTFGKAFVGTFSLASTWKLSRLQVFQPPFFFKKLTQSNFFHCLLSLSLKLPTCISQQELVNLLHSSLASICWWATEQPPRAATCQPWAVRKGEPQWAETTMWQRVCRPKMPSKDPQCCQKPQNQRQETFQGAGKGRKKVAAVKSARFRPRLSLVWITVFPLPVSYLRYF